MHELTFFRTWLPVIYLYVAGGIIFLAGMTIIVKSKSLKLDRPMHKRWFYVLLFGYFYYLGIHTFLTYAALNF
ncbi:MAG: hypothetical protein HQ507_04740 [Candidatus Marinimicrobia bacterium]|nr:hypothetical protein [Candidatus Neomarinimicrobiota bacterium]